LVFQRIPILQWLPKYQPGYLVEDFVAGLTVGLTAIPQGIAYAVVAGLPPQYGLYSAFMGCFVYCVFGSCKDITIGPTAIMALMVQSYVQNLGADYAVLATFMAGLAIFASGLLNLGSLVTFISTPVTIGFTTAAALTIGSGQVKAILGLSGKSNGFLESWINVFEHIGETRLWDTVLGLTSIALLLLLRVSVDELVCTSFACKLQKTESRRKTTFHSEQLIIDFVWEAK
jgi:solute carrier family 26 (sodium-independent sulfate anion transporter), member 11